MDELQPARPSPRNNPVERALNAASGLATRNEYLTVSRTLTYSYLFVLPLIILYEFFVGIINTGQTMEVRIGAEIWIKYLFGLIGLGSTLWVGAAVLVVGAGIFWYERKKKIPLRARYFGYMFFESAMYGMGIGMLVASLVASLFNIIWPPMLQVAAELGKPQQIVLSLGAGIYEELVFRLILVSLLVWLMKLCRVTERYRLPVAAIIGALIFSAVHYIGALGDPFQLPSFTFRFLMGLALNGLFLWRGFGVAAMTHALFDVFVTLQR